VKRALGVVAFVALLALLGLGRWVSAGLAPADPAAEATLPFRVERGEGLAGITQRLEREGLVPNARIAFAWGRFAGIAARLRAGDYDLSAATPPAEILEALTTGQQRTYPLIIPEGFTAAMIADRIAAEGLGEADAFSEAVADPSLARSLGLEVEHLEGYLFPETYRVPKGLAAPELVRLLVQQFLDTWPALAPKAAARGLTQHQVVTLASIVEKETGAAHERPLIASVFSNRLDRGMKLESDPTTIYGIPDFDGNLRRVHLDDASNPYNTYQIPALPPGPIASPGRASLLAVVEPAESEFLFFVSRNDGTHIFSKSYREHVNAVNRYQRRASR
jgi:UPF0755 protein